MSILLALILWAPTVPALPQDDDTEAKMKRLVELFQKLPKHKDEFHKLLGELSGGDPKKQAAILKEVVQKYAPGKRIVRPKSPKAANEKSFSVTLKTLALAQADFRANDRDRNRVNDFWAADVAGLYRIQIEQGKGKGDPIWLIDRSFAQADAHPAAPLETPGKLKNAKGRDASSFVAVGKPTPKAGYWYASLKYYIDGAGVKKPYDAGNGRAIAKFGIIAYPAQYGKSGIRTYVVDETQTVYWKDTKGKPFETFPADLRKDGWSKVE